MKDEKTYLENLTEDNIEVYIEKNKLQRQKDGFPPWTKQEIEKIRELMKQLISARKVLATMEDSINAAN